MFAYSEDWFSFSLLLVKWLGLFKDYYLIRSSSEKIKAVSDTLYINIINFLNLI